jgi:hypothetical protein
VRTTHDAEKLVRQKWRLANVFFDVCVEPKYFRPWI